MSLFLVVCILIILSVSLYRFFKNPTGSLSNPLFYLVSFGALYFLLPCTYLEFIINVAGWEIKRQSISEAYFWALWYEGIFFAFYLCSTDKKLVFNTSQPTKQVYLFAKYLNILLCAILLFIIGYYVPKIYALRGIRETAFEMYEYSVNAPFRFRQITYCHIVVMFVLIWKTKNLKYLFPCLGYLIIDYSHGGRTATMIIMLFAYFMTVLIKQKTFFKYAVLGILIMALSGVIQRSEASEFASVAFTSGIEFSNTFLTTVYLIDNPDYSLNGFQYFIVSLFKIFPGGIIDKMTEYSWYGDILSEHIGMGYGLAGNLITEAMIYGGKMFAIVNPFLIASISFLINGMKLKKTLVGILFTIILCCTMQVTIRQFFWSFILYPLQIVLFYCIWVYPDFKKTIFK